MREWDESRGFETLCDIVARGWFVPTDELDDWNQIDSPPAEWAKANAEGIEEYGPLLRLRDRG